MARYLDVDFIDPKQRTEIIAAHAAHATRVVSLTLTEGSRTHLHASTLPTLPTWVLVVS